MTRDDNATLANGQPRESEAPSGGEDDGPTRVDAPGRRTASEDTPPTQPRVNPSAAQARSGDTDPDNRRQSDTGGSHAGSSDTGRSDTGRSDTGATTHLPRPEMVLRSAEIEQTRRLAISGLVFNTLGLLIIPWLGGDADARRLCAVGFAMAWLNNAGLMYVASDETRYRQRFVVAFFVLAALVNFPIVYYLGVFGPIQAMFVLNVYSACLGYRPLVARVTLIGSMLPVLMLGGAMALGWLEDPGLVTFSAYGGPTAQAVLVPLFALFLLLTYTQARRTRDVMVASMVDRDEAVRLASHREALFLEARNDLERALHAGGLGRFTDQTVGSYKLGVVLGRGGMGEIYEGSHVDTNDTAAIKLLLPEVLGRPDYVRRFLREVRIAASLDSPHVVQVVEVGDESAPFPFLAMERLRGEDLAQILRHRQRLEPDEVVELIRQVGSGLEAAHEAGIVHRDLKPQNLFRCDGGPHRWKVLDFGVSKLVDGGGTLTQGETVGTPSYMAPEQARGDDVDGRADLYALGAVAYRALTGEQPFRGEQVAVILLAVLGKMPLRPSELRELPKDVDLVLALALAKQPEDRFASPGAFADALAAALDSKLDRRERRRARRLLADLPWREPPPVVSTGRGG